jgi:hypothetical protein
MKLYVMFFIIASVLVFTGSLIKILGGNSLLMNTTMIIGVILGVGALVGLVRKCLKDPSKT